MSLAPRCPIARQPDCRGLDHTTESAVAVSALDRAVDAFTRQSPDLETHLSAALEADAGFAMPHLLRGFAGALMLRGAWDGIVATSRDRARVSFAARGATAREIAMARALDALCGGAPQTAIEILDAALVEQPRDLLAAKLVHAVRFLIGDAAGMHASTAGLLPHWSADLPGRANIQGMHAFALVETGALDAAERIGREAVLGCPDDWWAVHAVAHALEMSGRPALGLRWLDQMALNSTRAGAFRRHLAWHQALFAIAEGGLDQALHLYDTQVWADPSDEYRDLANAIALLWRIEDAGGAVGPRWDALADRGAALARDARLAFAEAHGVLALVRAGRVEAAEAAVRDITAAARDGGLVSAFHPQVGLDLMASLIGTAPPPMDDFAPIGGSQAQRDLFVRHAIRAAAARRNTTRLLALLDRRQRRMSVCAWGAARRTEALGSADGDRYEAA